MALPLEDLDKLLSKCRNKYAKQYIQEAIQCYQAGAFRAAILSIWAAVTFDLFDKLKELAVAGEATAGKLIASIEKKADISDTVEFACLEKDFITIARDRFELISYADSIDLMRLQQDKKRCIKPLLNPGDEIFEPTSELVKVHIVSAITHLLQHPAYYGKGELDLLINYIESQAFPTNKEQIIYFLKDSVLAHARDSLFKEFFTYLIEKCISYELTFQQKIRYYIIFNTTIELYKRISHRILQVELPKIAATIKDQNVEQILYLVSYSPKIWPFFDDTSRKKVANYVRNLPINNVKLVKWLLSYGPLKKDIEYRIGSLTDEELTSIISGGAKSLNPIFLDRIVDFYAQSPSYEYSNEWMVKYYAYIRYFKPKHVEKIISSAGKNDYITGSYNFEELIINMRNTLIIPTAKFDELLVQHGLYDSLTAKLQI